MWDPGSPIRDQTSIPDIENMESQPLDHQGSPKDSTFFFLIVHFRPHFIFILKVCVCVYIYIHLNQLASVA